MTRTCTLIGFGEAGSTFAQSGGWGASVAGYDLLPDRRMALAKSGLTAADTPAIALADSPLVLSLVTADQALMAAQNYARYLAPHAIWCDMNSVAPATKRAAADAIAAYGGRYVDVAVLAPVYPAHMAVPLLISGKDAADAAIQLAQLGFRNIRIVGAEIGRASAIKMIRSVMVKGIEALSAEMMLAAEAAGVAEEVLASLDASERSQSWAIRAAYNRERMATHGLRRAAEMEESAKTLTALGVEPIMTQGTITRQRALGA